MTAFRELHKFNIHSPARVWPARHAANKSCNLTSRRHTKGRKPPATTSRRWRRPSREASQPQPNSHAKAGGSSMKQGDGGGGLPHHPGEGKPVSQAVERHAIL